MKIHRFIIQGCDLVARHLRIEDKELLNQIKNVLKLKSGEKVIISDGNLNDAEVRIVEIGNGFLEGEIMSVLKNANESLSEITLYCSLLKKDNFEWVVQKATEAGAREIIPVKAKRTVKLDIPKARMEKIAKEAAEQSGRGFIPVLRDSVGLGEALQHSSRNETNLFCEKGGMPITSIYGPHKAKTGIFIGPEGGWTEDEVEEARGSGCAIVSLSSLTLRAETAALIGVYLGAHFSIKYGE